MNTNHESAEIERQEQRRDRHLAEPEPLTAAERDARQRAADDAEARRQYDSWDGADDFERRMAAIREFRDKCGVRAAIDRFGCAAVDMADRW